MDDAGASTDNGAAIQVFACNKTAAQSWAWNSDDGTLRVLNKCLDVTGGATTSGTLLQLWGCNGTGAQEWRWRQQPTARGSRSQTVTILRVRFGGCPEVGRSRLKNNRFFSNSRADRSRLNR
jgi:Ricin-type beta-trefoil lectin domain